MASSFRTDGMRGSAAFVRSTEGYPGAARGVGERSLAYQHLRLRTPRRRLIGGAATAGAGGNTPSGKGKKGKGRPKTSGKKQKQKKPEADILSPAAMLNLYYIAHNVADCLYLRGFPWPGAPKGKKGKK
ncbi:small lysine-rich protein 1 [Apodemus sylvaticus]|uniref:small lysine-rich protein 1 n=1 Tax=Apodemus sylvaticus TaxID=10129 RepID=UPI002243BDB7|nr:small lysine-rich protein 1 [Apodemus sylvaticus]